MAKTLTIAELRKMSLEDLQKEIAVQRRAVAKMKMGLKLGKEKGSHLYKSAKRQLAQMLTVLSELQNTAPTPTIPTS